MGMDRTTPRRRVSGRCPNRAQPMRRELLEANEKPTTTPANYQEWLDQAMGPVFAANFRRSTPESIGRGGRGNSTVDWIGSRIRGPSATTWSKEHRARCRSRCTTSITLGAVHEQGWVLGLRTQARRGCAHRIRTPARTSRSERSEVLSFSDGTSVNYERLATTTNLRTS